MKLVISVGNNCNIFVIIGIVLCDISHRNQNIEVSMGNLYKTHFFITV